VLGGSTTYENGFADIREDIEGLEGDREILMRLIPVVRPVSLALSSLPRFALDTSEQVNLRTPKSNGACFTSGSMMLGSSSMFNGRPRPLPNKRLKLAARVDEE